MRIIFHYKSHLLRPKSHKRCPSIKLRFENIWNRYFVNNFKTSHPNLLILNGDNQSRKPKHGRVKNRLVKKLYRFCFIFCKMAFIPQDKISILSSIWYIILTTWFQHPNHLTNLTTLTIQPNNQINCPNQPNFPDHLTTQNILTEQWPTDLPWVKHNSDNRDHPNHSNQRSTRATLRRE